MLKERNKVLTVGILLNVIVAILGIVTIVYVFLPLFQNIPLGTELDITSEWIQTGFASI